MVRKKDSNHNLASEDLFNALLKDVEGLSEGVSDEESALADTAFGEPPELVQSDVLVSRFDEQENKLVPSVSSKLTFEETLMNSEKNFWEEAEKYSENKHDISFSKIPKDIGAPVVGEKYQGPSAAEDNFLDQIKFNMNYDGFSEKGIAPNLNSPIPSKPDSTSIGFFNNPNNANNPNNFSQLKTEIDVNNKFVPFDSPIDFPAAKVDGTEVVANADPTEVSKEQNYLKNNDADKTVAVTKFAQKQKRHLQEQNIIESTPEKEEKVFISTQKSLKSNSSQVSIDASLYQAENLRIAQNRILDLEKEIERLRQENDEILTASEIIRSKAEEYTIKISNLEKDNQEAQSEFKNELSIVKGSLVYTESENLKLKEKVEELEQRLKNDFKKIRIRERELENRLELLKAEKQAVVKSKDELLLELQRKNDVSKSEIETYRNKVQELNKTIESYQNQIKLTVRTLRLALSHVDEKAESQPIQYKKAT